MGSAGEALILRERVGWGVWGSSNSKQLPGGLPEVVCQRPSFAPAQSLRTQGPPATSAPAQEAEAWLKQALSKWARGCRFHFAQALERPGETVQECCA